MHHATKTSQNQKVSVAWPPDLSFLFPYWLSQSSSVKVSRMNNRSNHIHWQLWRASTALEKSITGYDYDQVGEVKNPIEDQLKYCVPAILRVFIIELVPIRNNQPVVNPTKAPIADIEAI